MARGYGSSVAAMDARLATAPGNPSTSNRPPLIMGACCLVNMLRRGASLASIGTLSETGGDRPPRLNVLHAPR